jgi:small subunit ribosomal protein S14
MARTAIIVKSQKEQKFSTRAYNRCPLCGRVHGFLRKFTMCRICFRTLALKGEIPGVTKSSW